MKTKIEAIANVIVIVMALAVGFVVLRGKVSGPRIPRSIAAGDRLAPVAGIHWSEHRRTLVLALRSDCHYCRDSAPFYQRLAQAQKPGGDDAEIVAVFPNDAEAARQSVKEDALPMRWIPAVPIEKWGVVGTPTLILVDSQGQVVRTWTGVLTPRGELEVIAALGPSAQAAEASRPLAGCQEDELNPLSADLGKGCESNAQNQK